ncbi:MAG: outer membrane protein assembly factor [Bacteroidetes bacterium MedPE-SWsnd-G2]|nr:MAG: outer membrane protein assembly factor [Bacteroidetes bacterium MedPE-SWsnd-G2]
MKSVLFVCLVLSFVSQTGFGQEPLVTDLKIEGVKKIKPTFVKRIARIKAGVKLDSTVIETDIKFLKQLPSVSHAYYQVFPVGDGINYNVIYHLEENFTIIPAAAIYTTNKGEFAYRLSLYEFNTFGQSIIFGGFYQDDIYSSFGLNLRAPYVFSRQLGLAVNYQDLTTLEPVFFESGTRDYRYNNRSVEVLGLFQIHPKHRIELGVNVFTEDYKLESEGDNEDIPEALKVDKLLYKFGYEFNDLDYHYQYVSGFKNWFNFQVVRTKGESDFDDFLIGWNDFLYYKRLGKKGNWASRLRLGLATNNDSPFAPFSVDNNLNIRGVGNTIDRGTGSIVLNTEYRYTLYEKKWFVLQGNTFIDAGSWQNPGGDFGDFSDDQNIRVYPGIGLRFIHKSIFNAIFRIDYGYGLTKDASSGLVFGIGQYF